MHIAVVNNIYPPIMAGGAELVVAYLCEGLVERGHRVTVLSTCGPEMEPHPVEHRNGVEIIRFFPKNLYWSFDRAKQGRGGGMRNSLRSARWHLRDAWNHDAGWRAAAIFAECRPDILHTHLLDGMSAAIWRRARALGMPVIHTAHDYHLLCPRAFLLSESWKICRTPTLACRIFRSWHLHTTRDVDVFASPSKFLLDLHVQAGLRSNATAVVPNGIPLRHASRPMRKGPPSRFLLLSRLTVEKGIRIVLEAMSRLPDLTVELTIGGRGPLEEEVTQAAARDPRIHFLGYVSGEAKSAAFAHADHLLLPSLWYENAPTVILEAAAHGLWLIGSRIGGIPEFVEEGRTGQLFEPGDAAGLVEAMKQAATNKDRLSNIQQAGEDLVRNFTVPRMIDGYLAHYERLLAARA